jgi:hypothetical protein
MGRRSRKRVTTSPPPQPPSPAAPPRPAPATPRRRARLEEAPSAPWSPFPLVELVTLAGIVLIVVGFVAGGSRRGLLLACGFALVSLAAVELAIREHFSGYRSHSTLLAGVCAVAVDVPLFFTQLRQELLLAIGAVVFAGMIALLRRTFQRRSGGLGFRA